MAKRIFTPDDIATIRSRRAAGEMVKTIAAAYGVTSGTISAITTGRWYKR